MREILPSQVMVDALRELGNDSELNPDLYYDFTNQIHWPLFLDFVTTARGLDYKSLPVLEQAGVCVGYRILARQGIHRIGIVEGPDIVNTDQQF